MTKWQLLRRDVWGPGLKLDELKGFKMDFLLGGGESVMASYPRKPASYTVDKSDVTKPGPERPGKAGKRKASDTLTDVLLGGDPQILVVSARMKALIEARERAVEFLPVTIKGHKEPYFIANFLEHVACLDLKKSGATIDGDEVSAMEKLVLRPAAIPADRALFQLKENRDLFLVRDDLAAAFEEAGLTGIEIMPLDQYSPT